MAYELARVYEVVQTMETPRADSGPSLYRVWSLFYRYFQWCAHVSQLLFASPTHTMCKHMHSGTFCCPFFFFFAQNLSTALVLLTVTVCTFTQPGTLVLIWYPVRMYNPIPSLYLFQRPVFTVRYSASPPPPLCCFTTQYVYLVSQSYNLLQFNKIWAEFPSSFKLSIFYL